MDKKRKGGREGRVEGRLKKSGQGGCSGGKRGGAVNRGRKRRQRRVDGDGERRDRVGGRGGGMKKKNRDL